MSTKIILILALAAILWLAINQPSNSQSTPETPKIAVDQGYLDSISSTDPCRSKGLGHGMVADAITKFASLDENCALFGR